MESEAHGGESLRLSQRSVEGNGPHWDVSSGKVDPRDGVESGAGNQEGRRLGVQASPKPTCDAHVEPEVQTLNGRENDWGTSAWALMADLDGF